MKKWIEFLIFVEESREMLEKIIKSSNEVQEITTAISTAST